MLYQIHANLLIVTDHKPLVKFFADRTLDKITNTQLFQFRNFSLFLSERTDSLSIIQGLVFTETRYSEVIFLPLVPKFNVDQS